jgi:galactolipid galactosyltransferase
LIIYQTLIRNSENPDSRMLKLCPEDETFFFGLATAPAHVEDRLEDAWLQFATEHSCDDKEAMHDQKPADALLASVAGDGGSQVASRTRGVEKGDDGEKRKPLKVAMEAMLRGFETFVEGSGESGGSDTCGHNVAAWHNVPYP